MKKLERERGATYKS